MNSYVDAITYTKAPTGVLIASQIGNIGRIGATTQGATTLVLTAAITQVDLNPFDAIYITDGSSSEIVQVGNAGATIGATSIPLQAGTQYAHSAGAVYVTDGTQGSLGQAIFQASRYLEDVCYQALWTTVYTGEILTMPTMRASIDNRWNLHFRPRHFPITVFTSIAIQTSQLLVSSLDPTQAIIDSDQQTVDIPNINFTSSTLPPPQGAPYPWQQIDRGTSAWLTLGYTAGFAAGQLPPAITQAAILLTSDNFVPLYNPLGADDVREGERSVTYTMRGDLTGESLLVKKAKKLLQPYVALSF